MTSFDETGQFYKNSHHRSKNTNWLACTVILILGHYNHRVRVYGFGFCGTRSWLVKDLLLEIPLACKNSNKVSIHCDSQATLARAYSEVYNEKSRHISLRHEYVRKLIKDGIISLMFVRSSYNLADPFTKPLTRDLVKTTSRGMGLKLLE